MFARVPASEQLAILGPAKFAAYKAGTISLDDLRGVRRDRQWGLVGYERSLADVVGVQDARQWLSRAVGAVKRAVRRSASRTLATQENAIRQQRFETAVFVDPATGAVVLRKDGQQYEVTFTWQELAQMRGMVLTHNHPSGWNYPAGSELRKWGTSFSEADLGIAASTEMAEIRAVAPGVRYSLKPPAGGWNQQWWRRVGKPAYDGIYAQVAQEFVAAMKSGRMTMDEANMRLAHEVLLRWAQRTGAV